MRFMSNTSDFEPLSFTAGDTVEWTKTLPDYPVSNGWVLSYCFVGSSIVFVTGTNDGTNHKIIIPASTSAIYAAGDYRYQAYVTKSGIRKEIGDGFITINPNFATITTPSDQRSHVKKVLDSIEATLEGRATEYDTSYSIAGRSLSKMSLDELIKARHEYKKLHNQEILNERRKRGLATSPIKQHKIFFSEYA
jgi:hypothetical protein